MVSVVSVVVSLWNADMVLPNAAAEGMSLVVQIVDPDGSLAVSSDMPWAALPKEGVNPASPHPVVIGKPVYTDNAGNRVSAGPAYVAQIPVFIFPDAVAPGSDSAIFWLVDTISWDTAGIFVVYDDAILTSVAVYSPTELSIRPIHQAQALSPPKWHKGTVVLKNLIVFDTLYIDTGVSDTVLYPTNYGYRNGIPFTIVVKDTVLVGPQGVIWVQDGILGGTWNNQVPSGGAQPGANGDYITGRDGGGGSGAGGGSFGTQGGGSDPGDVCGNPMLVPFMGGSAGGAYGNHKDPSPAWGGNGGGFFGLISDGPVKLSAGSSIWARGGNYKQVGDSRAGGGSGGGIYISGGVNNGVLVLEAGAGLFTPGGSGGNGGGNGGAGRVRTDGAVPDTVIGAYFAGLAMDSVWSCDTCATPKIGVALWGRPNSSVLVYAYAVDSGALFQASVDIGPSADPLVPETLYVDAVHNDWHCVWAVNVGMVSDWTNILYAYMSSGATEFVLTKPLGVGESAQREGFRVLTKLARAGEPIRLIAYEQAPLEIYSSSGARVKRLSLEPGENYLIIPQPGVYYLRSRKATSKLVVF